MSTKEQVLHILIERGQEPISGQKIADRLTLSRNSVWKAIESLREDGYVIEGVPQRGYLLKKRIQTIDPKLIKPYLPVEWGKLNVFYQPSVTSTNDIAKEYVINHPDQEALFLTIEQTAGRGRYGRSFYSQLQHGLYFTLAIHPTAQDPLIIPRYTLAVATALLEALREIVDEPKKLKVKWINDLFYKNRKISGILSELTTNLESFEINHVIIGIGINLAGIFSNQDGIKNVAGTIFGERLPKKFDYNQLMITFLNHFHKYHLKIDKSTFVPVYQEHLLGLNQIASYTKGEETHEVKILGINPDGHLIVEDSTGETSELTGPDVSFSSQQFIDKD